MLYPRTDPHWTAIGAFIAYQRLADEISRVAPMHRVVEEDVIFIETTLVGELGFKVEPQMEAPGASVAVKRPTAYLVADNCVNNTGSMLITECPEAPPGTCVVLGDSYSDALSLYLAASFRKYVYAYTPRMDYDLVREHRPDVVVTVLNERFMITPPDDLRGQSVRELEHEKKAHGLLREETPVFQRRPAAQP